MQMISVQEKNPDLVLEWDEENEKTADEVSYGSNTLVKWLGRCGHRWEASPKSRNNGQGCPYCAGKRVLIGFNDIRSKCPHLVSEWSSKNELDMEDLTVGSAQKVIWVCSTCGYEWSAAVKNRVNGSGCPRCAGNKLVRGENDLETVHPDLASEWSSKNGKLKACDVMPFSNHKVWWKCNICGYEWKSYVSSRSKGSGCPCCQSIVLVPGINDFLTKYPGIAIEWSQDNMGMLPSDFSPRSRKRVMWTCSRCGHDWCATIFSRCFGKDKGCTFCARERSAQKYVSYLQEKREKAYQDSNWMDIAVREYVKENNLKVEYNTDKLIGVPVDYYFSDYNTVIILPQSFHMNYHGRRMQGVVNDLLRKKKVRLVRILEPGMDGYDDCECVWMDEKKAEEIRNILREIVDYH